MSFRRARNTDTSLCCFVFNLTSGVRNTAPWHSNRKQRKKKSSGQQPAALSTYDYALVLQHFEATQSQDTFLAWKLGESYVIQPPAQHPGHSHESWAAGHSGHEPSLCFLWPLARPPTQCAPCSALQWLQYVCNFTKVGHLPWKNNKEHLPGLQGALTETRGGKKKRKFGYLRAVRAATRSAFPRQEFHNAECINTWSHLFRLLCFLKHIFIGSKPGTGA